MPSVYKSGAFIQQCFAVHPRCLDFKSAHLPDRVVLTCTSCKMHHHLALRSIATRSSALADSPDIAPGSVERAAADFLDECLKAHVRSVTIRAMDVIQDVVGLRCRDCRRLFDLDIASFESHQL
jgi:hypothetical protein